MEGRGSSKFHFRSQGGGGYLERGLIQSQKRVQPYSEPFLPIRNLPHLCGDFSTKNQLFPTGNEGLNPSVEKTWGS